MNGRSAWLVQTIAPAAWVPGTICGYSGRDQASLSKLLLTGALFGDCKLRLVPNIPELLIDLDGKPLSRLRRLLSLGRCDSLVYTGAPYPARYRCVASAYFARAVARVSRWFCDGVRWELAPPQKLFVAVAGRLSPMRIYARHSRPPDAKHSLVERRRRE